MTLQQPQTHTSATTALGSDTSLLIIDSGVGGLSVLKEMRQLLPHLHTTYVADNAYYPYGTKEPEALIARVSHLVQSFLKHRDYAALVIACNTASTIVLPALRGILKLPVIGVVPAIKPAAQLSANKVIGLLATPGTIARAYTDHLIRDFAADCQVIRVGSTELVDMAEQLLENKAPNEAHLQHILKPFWDHPNAAKLDTIVLGCTHFPLLKPALIKCSQTFTVQPLQWIDSGPAIAKQIKQILMHHNMLPANSQDHFNTGKASITKIDTNKGATQGQHELIFTQNRSVTHAATHMLEQLGITQISCHNI